MLFTYDTELTLRAAMVLVNTDRVEGEQLADQSDLSATWMTSAGPAGVTATTPN